MEQSNNQYQRMLDFLQLSQKKDKIDLEKSQKSFAEEFKGIKREDIFKAPEKLSLWKRIRKVLNF